MNKQFKVALSHDIDRTLKTYQYFTKSIRAISKGNFGAFKNQIYSLFEKDNYWNFDRILAIENKYGVKSTVFFLNESIKWNPFKLGTFKLAWGRYNIKSAKIKTLIRKLDKDGWEIGVHGSYNSYKSLELLRKEKETLETIVGHEVIGIRQHYLNLNSTTWSLQEKAGFKYDSSLGYAGSKGTGDQIGFKDEKLTPFFPLQNEFLQIPLVLMDSNFMSTNNRWEELDKIITICKEHDAILVINFHNHVFNSRDFPGFGEAYEKIIEKCLSENGVFYKMEELYHLHLNKEEMT